MLFARQVPLRRTRPVSRTRPAARRRTRLLAAAAVLGPLLLTACTPTVAVQPAADAANPACAPAMIALPDTLADQKLRQTDSQGTAAWGDPSQVILRCGVNVPGPTTDPCVGVNGVDWVIKEGSGSEAWTITTFGRKPAVEVLFDPNKVASSTVLGELASSMSKLPKTGECSDLSQTLQLPPEQG